MHEYATFLLHSFIATPIVTLLTKTFFSSLCSFLHPIANHVLFVHRALPLLADALDEIDASQITAELTSDSAVQQVTARLLRALTLALPAPLPSSLHSPPLNLPLNLPLSLQLNLPLNLPLNLLHRPRMRRL